MNEDMVRDLEHTLKTIRKNRRQFILMLVCICVALAGCAGIGINSIVGVAVGTAENPTNMAIGGTIQVLIAAFLWAYSRRMRSRLWKHLEMAKLAAVEIKIAIEAAKKDDLMEVGIRVLFARGFIEEIKE